VTNDETMSELLKIYPKSPGLTLEQAKETYQKIQEFKNALDPDGVAIYPNWPDKTKANWPRKSK